MDRVRFGRRSLAQLRFRLLDFLGNLLVFRIEHERLLPRFEGLRDAIEL